MNKKFNRTMKRNNSNIDVVRKFQLVYCRFFYICCCYLIFKKIDSQNVSTQMDDFEAQKLYIIKTFYMS